MIVSNNPDFEHPNNKPFVHYKGISKEFPTCHNVRIIGKMQTQYYCYNSRQKQLNALAGSLYFCFITPTQIEPNMELI